MIKWIVLGNVIFFMLLYLLLKERIDTTYFYWKEIYKASKVDEKETYAYKAGLKTPPFPSYSDNFSSLRGVDTNKNGVRDDLEFYINRMAQDETVLRYYYQEARSLDFALSYKKYNEKGEYMNPMQFGIGHKFAFVGECGAWIRSQDKYKNLNKMIMYKLFFNTEDRRSFLREKIYRGGFFEGLPPGHVFTESHEYCD